MYYRAECNRLQGYYPKAADLYVNLLNKFSHTPYREQAIQHMFDIANYWLDDTRAEMREYKEKREGKRWVVWPRFISFDRTKPFLDREGRAIEKLEQVRLHDGRGPLADHALFMCGVVKLFNEDYRNADTYFSEVANKHKDSPLAAKSVELAIYCKHMSTGGSDYDGRKVAEARTLVQTAFDNYPSLAHEKRAFLLRQLDNINLQQADKDFKMAEFYQRTGHPGSAYFYYELVRRRYPGTKYAEMSVKRMNELRGKLEKEQAKQASGPPAGPGPGGPALPPSGPVGPRAGDPPGSLPGGGLPGGPGR
jgi:outer membrane protein assembly factor BamD (BamD/ComL family)